MTKRQIIKEVRDVMVGRSALTNITVGKKAGKWTMSTSLNSQNLSSFVGWTEVQQFSHCCNSATLEEVAELIGDPYHG